MSLPERTAQVMALPMQLGMHESFERGMCVLEAASYIAGEPWSDHPQCVCPVIAAFMRTWNDALPSDAERDRLLKPLLVALIGTRSTKAVEERRAYLALDWLVRVCTPKWLDLVPTLAPPANRLRELEEITDEEGAKAASAAATAAAATAAVARAARYYAASAADAAEAAARYYAASASAAAAEAAAAAAGNAAAAVAAAARYYAAVAAAVATAAAATLKPTVEWLQSSAQDLVRRMIEVTP